MNCKETLENINLLLDGELNSEVENEVIHHLVACWHCKEIKDNELALKEAIKEKLTYRKELPSDMFNRIKSAVGID